MSGEQPKELFIYLVSDDVGNHFTPDHFRSFSAQFPDITLTFLADKKSLLDSLASIQWLDTWYFDAKWFSQAPRLKAVFTPAAGKDWVHEDPKHVIPTYYGKFHGPMIAESMLGLMLHFNRNMSEMLALQNQRVWSRNAQQGLTLLKNQTALIVGYGNIGTSCGQLLTKLGMRVLGYQRQHGNGIDPETGVEYVDDSTLVAGLGKADHVINLLPGGEETRYFMSRDQFKKMKPTAFLYNFGRGSTIRETDLVWALDSGIIAGAGIDVTEIEPLPTASPLWRHKKVILLPHSACVFEEYQHLHVQELVNLVKLAPN